MELHQLQKQLSYDGDLSPCQFEFNWTKHFELESGNEYVDGQTNRRTELHQFQKEPSNDGDLSPCQI